jgi:hypothetical protein
MIKIEINLGKENLADCCFKKAGKKVKNPNEELSVKEKEEIADALIKFALLFGKHWSNSQD